MPKSEKQKFNDFYRQLADCVKNNRTIEPRSKEENSLLQLKDTYYGKKKLGWDAYEKAVQGDFSSFEKVAPALRNYLASQYMDQVDEKHPGLLSQPLDDPQLQQFLEENAMNPAFRLGCSLRQHTGSHYNNNEYNHKNYNSDNYLKFDDYMNSHIMQKTLQPLDSSQRNSLKEMFPKEEDFNEAVSQNIEKQVTVAKTLFLAHIGKTTLETAPGKKEPLGRSVASMAAHCSRTAYVFQPGDNKNVSLLMDALTGKGLGDAAGTTRRGAATHSVTNGKGIGSFRENKVFPASFTNQHGMDIAIGGLGNPGIPGLNGKRQTLKNDGSCGHMYLRADPGSKDRCTSLLIGFESDSPSAKHNQQGHEHTMTAKPEYMSSFLGQRTDEMGSKYGGRVVDCTSFNLKELTDAVNEFSTHYRAMLMEGMHNPDARRQLEQANICLCGTPMDSNTLANTLTDIGMPPKKAHEITIAGNHAKGIKANLRMPEKSPVEITPVKEPEKPGRWIRFKAAFGSSHAKETIKEFQLHCQQAGEKAHNASSGSTNNEWTVQTKFCSINQKINCFSSQFSKSNTSAKVLNYHDLEEVPDYGIKSSSLAKSNYQKQLQNSIQNTPPVKKASGPQRR